eukprot:TRINITY_DN9067_c0_g1_i4.p1 TRINITY_DN9067_c0_g1~~TRINITY_DN9067_c0_g1_i4.p1  ORF type:complete len:359 (+),score=51.22 TRINITY_DN9067_c0_g1_i4:97-1173(+)
MIRRPPRSTHCISSAASDVYKRQVYIQRKRDNLLELNTKANILNQLNYFILFYNKIAFIIIFNFLIINKNNYYETLKIEEENKLIYLFIIIRSSTFCAFSISYNNPISVINFIKIFRRISHATSYTQSLPQRTTSNIYERQFRSRMTFQITGYFSKIQQFFFLYKSIFSPSYLIIVKEKSKIINQIQIVKKRKRKKKLKQKKKEEFVLFFHLNFLYKNYHKKCIIEIYVIFQYETLISFQFRKKKFTSLCMNMTICYTKLVFFQFNLIQVKKKAKKKTKIPAQRIGAACPLLSTNLSEVKLSFGFLQSQCMPDLSKKSTAIISAMEAQEVGCPEPAAFVISTAEILSLLAISERASTS